MTTFQYNPQSYVSDQNSEFQKATIYDILDYARIGMFIPFQVNNYATATIAEKVNIDIYLELFSILRDGLNAGLLTEFFLINFVKDYNKLPFNQKAQTNNQVYQILKEKAEIKGVVLDLVGYDDEADTIDNVLDELNDDEKLKALYYMATGEELTEELQNLLEGEIDITGTDITKMTPEQVAYLAQTATSRYLDKGAVVVEDVDVEISNTNNPNNVRSNTPITRERLKEMMNNQTNVVDELRQKNTKAYSNIPGLNRPIIPVQNIQTSPKVPLKSTSTTDLTSSDYSDYQ